MPFALNVNGDLPGWALPGTVIATFNLSTPANVSNSFMARQGGVQNAFPVTASGLIVLLDAGGDKVARNHLGAIARNGTELAWTASPFGEWTLVKNWTLVDDGTGTGNLTNITTYFIDKPGGVFGSGNPGTNYAAGYPCVLGTSIIVSFSRAASPFARRAAQAPRPSHRNAAPTRAVLVLRRGVESVGGEPVRALYRWGSLCRPVWHAQLPDGLE
jgi:hypothetical protein